MKNYLFFFVLLFLFLIPFSCTNRTDQKTADHRMEEATPEVLLEEKGEYSDLISSRGKNWRYDIIHQLFEEAMEKDATLKSLNDAMLKMPKRKADSLANFEKYSGTNEQYWLASEGYIQRITDTLKRQEIASVFEKWKNDYTSTMAPYQDQREILAAKSLELQDQLTILKLLVSAELMQNYQRNEIPTMAPLENLIKDYDRLIEEAQGRIEGVQ